ncbi:MAG: anhydro-N-acetylmuramic acid kinase [Halioglobus sp.]|nr:anhydro-N-acetylmuramic acid kinase [Halioglobus sp.]
MSASLYVGLMSGTSMDAVDAALVSIDSAGTTLIATHLHPIPDPMRRQIAALSRTGPDEIERMGTLDRELGALFAVAALQLLRGASTPPARVAAIGSHGQTIRHRPPCNGRGTPQSFTLQIGDPNTIAEHSGITTVADFRRRDIAAGGEGAPLAPAFHAAAFARPDCGRAIVNIGGFANVTLLDGARLGAGFDTGPGNSLLDGWIHRHRGEACDRDGRWAAGGTVVPALLERLLQHPFFSRRGPRSTGREAFHMDWLDECIGAQSPVPGPRDVQATLAELTAVSIARGIQSGPVDVAEVYLCGGGAHNRDLVNRLGRHLPGKRLDSTAGIGMAPDWVEAVTFAWLAHQTLRGLAGNAPVVTGARGTRVLGGIYPGA